jgi:hypothetical protein
MGSGNPDWLRDMTDDELLTVADELHHRAEMFEAGTRLLVNDELRRRKLPLIGYGTSRY